MGRGLGSGKGGAHAMNALRRRRWLQGLAALAAGLLGAAWLLRAVHEVSDGPAMPPVPTAASPAMAAQDSGHAAASTGAGASAPSPSAASAPVLSDAALASIEAQWCSHGSLQESQQQAAALAGEGETLDAEAQSRLRALEDSWPSTQARRQVRARLLRAWQASLRRHGDDASLALALLIGHGPHETPSTEALQALQDLAMRSGDPWVQAVALQRRAHCLATPGCRAVPAERWALLEPENLAAWVAATPPDAPPSIARWKQWSQARRWDDGSSRMMLTLLALPWPDKPGLEQEIAMMELTGWRVTWSTMLPLPLTRACRVRELPAQARQLCTQAADWLWGTPGASLLDWTLAVHLAQPGELGSQARWQAREQLVARAREEATLRDVERFDPASHPGDRCAWQASLLRHLRHWAQHGEWAKHAQN